jgi:hypothetical protein
MFGRRRQDEDPFAALRDGSTYKSAPSTIDATRPATSTAALDIQRRRRRGAGILGTQIIVRLMVVGIMIAVIAVPLLSIVSANRSATSVPSISVPSVSFGPSSGPAQAALVPPTANPVSYLTPAGVRAGLRRVAKLVPGAGLVLLRVDATSLSATAMLPNGAAKLVYIGPSATLVTAGPQTGETPIPISQISPSVVGRLVLEMGRRFHVAPRQIDYMVISSPAGLPAHWIVFSKAPAHPGFSATLSGAGLSRIPG